jgi:hypothetical protein
MARTKIADQGHVDKKREQWIFDLLLAQQMPGSAKWSLIFCCVLQ